MENTNDITQIIINTINTIFESLLSSIDNNLYSVLDDITFISSDILKDENFENIFGTSTTNGILLIANSFLLGYIVFYASKHFLSHFTYNQTESPFSFILKIILCGIAMNFSFFIVSFILDFNFNITLSIRALGETLFNKSICFSELINNINSKISVDTSSLNIFSLDGIIKSTMSVSLLSLVFSYAFRYIMVKLFILISPFAFLSLSLNSTSWFFKSWFKNIFALLFIQIIISLILLILFSINYSSNNLLPKCIYIGGIYALIQANSFVREFIGGVSTDIAQSVKNLSHFKK